MVRKMFLNVLVVLMLSLVVRSELPAPLTIDNFDTTIKQDFHFIEFYSPYCSHCKLLAPTWESTYNKFESDSQVLNVHMNQVNCVESGDLCDRENIRYYPLLRLYQGNGESGKLKLTYPSKYKRNEKTFIKFMKEQTMENLQDLPNVSKHIKTQQMLKILNGDIEEPILLSFWPTNDKQLNEQNFDSMNTLEQKDIDTFFIDECPECFELKNYWGRLSNQLSETINTGFFNCMSNKKICSSLGLTELIDVSTGKFKSPVIMLFLPRQGGNKIKYSFDTTDFKGIIKWSEKLVENSKYQNVTVKDLSKKMQLTSNIGRQPSSDLIIDNKISIVYYFDQDTVVQEDFDLLPHLLQHIMDLPFDISLYISGDKEFENFVVKQEKSLLKYINYNETEPLEEFNEEMHFVNSITSMPTLYCFKDSSLLSDKFTNFGPKYIRNPKNLKNFITKNSIPFLQELTPELYTKFFPKEFQKAAYTKDDKIVITMVDSSNFQEMMQLKLQMSIEEHEFHYVTEKKNYEYISSKRQAKLDKIKDSPKLRNYILREKIDHSINKVNTIFTYLDISNEENIKFLNNKGWNIFGKNYKLGDTIVVSRFDYSYWDKDFQGHQLRNDPYVIRETLKLISFGNSGVRANLVNSPFAAGPFRFLDTVHRYGFLGYALLFGFIWVSINIVRSIVRRRKYSKLIEQRNKGLGILGRIPKKD